MIPNPTFETISLQPDVIDLWYFTLLFMLGQMIEVWNIVADVQSVNKLVRISEIQLCSSKANLFESIFES